MSVDCQSCVRRVAVMCPSCVRRLPVDCLSSIGAQTVPIGSAMSVRNALLLPDDIRGVLCGARVTKQIRQKYCSRRRQSTVITIIKFIIKKLQSFFRCSETTCNRMRLPICFVFYAVNRVAFRYSLAGFR